MRRTAQIVSWVALAGTIVPAALLLADRLTLDQVKVSMLVAAFAWFIVTPFWMGRPKPA